MDAKQIAIIVVVVIIVIVVMRKMLNSSSQLSSLTEATKTQTIQSSSLSNNSQTTNYAYSIWFYIDDWNYRFGQQKMILGRLDSEKNPGPSIVLGAMENDLTINIACYPTTGTDLTASVIQKCNVKNVPLQKWCNLIMSVYGQTLDVYLDGKLYKTCVLSGPPKVNTDADIVITPNGGFSGFTSKLVYKDDAVNPQQAYNIYKKGYNTGGLGGLFDYSVRVQLLENDTVEGSFQI